MPHFLRDVILPSAIQVMWDAASVEFRSVCLRVALKRTKTKWDEDRIKKVAERKWDEQL